MSPGQIESLEDRLRELVWAVAPSSEEDWTSLEGQLARFESAFKGRLRLWLDGLVAAVGQRDADEVTIEAARGLRLLAESSVGGKTTSGLEPGRVRQVETTVSGLQGLKGCGPKTAALLAEHGIETPEDLALFLPKGYEDFRSLLSPSQLEEGMTAAVRGKVDKVVWAGPRGRRHLEVHLSDPDGGKLVCLWFRVPRGMVGRLQSAEEIVAAGRAYRYRNRLQMAHPRLLSQAEPVFVPRYPRIAGLGNGRLWNLCRQAARLCEDDGIPGWVLGELGLPSFDRALALVHDPLAEGTEEDLTALAAGRHPAQVRLRFTELFYGQMALALRRRNLARRGAVAYDAMAAGDVVGALPFAPTQAQKRVIEEIFADLASPRPMQRLLQGDVGSGKTLVAFAAALQVLAQGHKVAFMAPTEILVEQHARVLAGWLPKDRPVVRLTASMPAGVRRSVAALLAAPGPLVAVGTLALLSSAIEDLGLVIIDEQHRFGVAQRHRLRTRGLGVVEPHLLVMTATPIPRTLALTMHGDLDLSVIDEMPAGRVEVQTELFEYHDRRRGWEKFLRLVEQGLQAFVVCPLVSDSEKRPLASAEKVAEKLARRLDSVGLLHGRMSAQEKEEVIGAFAGGKLQVLVATTVVEVGVDIPSAAVMAVVDAERFGLSQLHQLRGRVGRGKVADAHCLLLAGRSADPRSLERLAVLVETTDGFEIAERDLALRGPGDVTGTRQAGSEQGWVGMGLTELLLAARDQARKLVERDPDLAQPGHRRLAELLAHRSLPVFGGEAG